MRRARATGTARTQTTRAAGAAGMPSLRSGTFASPSGPQTRVRWTSQPSGGETPMMDGSWGGWAWWWMAIAMVLFWGAVAWIFLAFVRRPSSSAGATHKTCSTSGTHVERSTTRSIEPAGRRSANRRPRIVTSPQRARRTLSPPCRREAATSSDRRSTALLRRRPPIDGSADAPALATASAGANDTIHLRCFSSSSSATSRRSSISSWMSRYSTASRPNAQWPIHLAICRADQNGGASPTSWVTPQDS